MAKYTEQQSLAKMAAYCSKAERCEFDVKQKLDMFELENDSINKIINYLKKENYLNENRFCLSFIKDKINFNKWGHVKIKYELRKKQISNQIIDTCFAEIDSELIEDNLCKILKTKSKSIKSNNTYDLRNKLTRFALSRGYTYDQTNKALSMIEIKTLDDYGNSE